MTAALRDRTAALMGNHGAVLVGRGPAQGAEHGGVPGVRLRRPAAGDGQRRPVRVLDDDEIAEVGRRLAGYGQQAGGQSNR